MQAMLRYVGHYRLDERDGAQKRQDMLRLAQRNRRFARLLEAHAREQEGRPRQADLEMAESLRDTARQLEAQVREPAGSRGIEWRLGDSASG
jgi:hypothetical protein